MAPDPIAIISGLVSLAILGLLIWLCVMVYKWYKNPREAPAWIQNIYYYLFPRVYEKGNYGIISPPITSSKFVEISNSTASNCASNCNTTEKCNTFVYDEQTSKCYYEKEEAVNDTSVLVELPNVYTYVASGSTKPMLAYDFVDDIDYTTPSTLIKSITGDKDVCLRECAETANCVAISMTNQTSNNCSLVSSTATQVSDSNVMSYMSTTPLFEAATF